MSDKIKKYNEQLREVAKITTATPSVEELEAEIERLQDGIKAYIAKHTYRFDLDLTELEALLNPPEVDDD